MCISLRGDIDSNEKKERSMTTNTETEVEKKEDILKVFEDANYQYLSRLFDRWKRHVYFTESGKARLAAIIGYIVGLKHAQQEDFAKMLAEDLDMRIRQIGNVNNVAEYLIAGQGGEEATTIRVPGMKASLGDDGTHHGFSVLWYRAVDPADYNAKLKVCAKKTDARLASGIAVYESFHEQVVIALNLVERTDPSNKYSDEITEYKYVNNQQIKVYYRVAYNGGLIYHGPGAGQTFTVSLTKGGLWGVHT